MPYAELFYPFGAVLMQIKKIALKAIFFILLVHLIWRGGGIYSFTNFVTWLFIFRKHMPFAKWETSNLPPAASPKKYTIPLFLGKLAYMCSVILSLLRLTAIKIIHPIANGKKFHKSIPCPFRSYIVQSFFCYRE